MINRYKKIIIPAVIIGTIFSNFSSLGVPKAQALDAGAGWAYNAMWSVKEFGLDTAARFLARKLLSGTINTMIKKIQGSGRTGRSPSFIQNWRNFLTDAQYRGEDVFRSILGNTVLCPQNANLKTIFKVPENSQPPIQNFRVNNLDPYTRRARCTMPKDWTVADFNKAFDRNGGWDALFKLAEPQNNFYGAFLMSIGEIEAQRAMDLQSDQFESLAGQGFTGIRGGVSLGGVPNSCANAPLVGYCSNGLGSCSSDADCAITGPMPPDTLPTRGYCLDRRPAPSQARCTFLGNVTTPGKLLGEATAQTIDQNLSWLTTSDEISEVLVAVIVAVMDRLDNFMLAPRGDTKARQNSRPPADTHDDPYTACAQQCSNRSGEAFSTCVEQCSSKANIPMPGSGPTPTPTPTGPPSYPNVLLCTDIGFGGICETFLDNDPVLGDPNNIAKGVFVAEDAASSIRVPAGATIYLCQDIAYGGPNNTGVCEPISADDPDLSDNSVGDNTVSSITFFPPQVNPSCGAIIRIADPDAGYCNVCPPGGCVNLGPTLDCVVACYYNPFYQSVGTPPIPECSDTIDNEPDGFTDYPDDGECTGPNDISERT